MCIVMQEAAEMPHQTAVNLLSLEYGACQLRCSNESLALLQRQRMLAEQHSIQGSRSAAVQHLSEALPMSERLLAIAPKQVALEVLVVRASIMLELADALAQLVLVDTAASSHPRSR